MQSDAFPSSRALSILLLLWYALRSLGHPLIIWVRARVDLIPFKIKESPIPPSDHLRATISARVRPLPSDWLLLVLPSMLLVEIGDDEQKQADVRPCNGGDCGGVRSLTWVERGARNFSIIPRHTFCLALVCYITHLSPQYPDESGTLWRIILGFVTSHYWGGGIFDQWGGACRSDSVGANVRGGATKKRETIYTSEYSQRRYHPT